MKPVIRITRSTIGTTIFYSCTYDGEIINTDVLLGGAEDVTATRAREVVIAIERKIPGMARKQKEARALIARAKAIDAEIVARNKAEYWKRFSYLSTRSTRYQSAITVVSDAIELSSSAAKRELAAMCKSSKQRMSRRLDAAISQVGAA